MNRSTLREHIFKTVFQIEFRKSEEMPESLEIYFEGLEEATPEDLTYIQEKFEKVAAKVPEIDALIDQASENWKTKRMSKVDLAILRLAVYEMKWDEDIPVKVAINEAVELAKNFSQEESPSFVNGVLGKISQM